MDNQTLFVFKKQKEEYNMVKQLKKLPKQLRKASKLHAGQAKIIANYVKNNEKKKKRPKSRNRKKA
jgi:hypothetical protein|tara:strand:+ start:594 stop:791 length:198 start_codon:yes stop_codon:yes gene_type:complete